MYKIKLCTFSTWIVAFYLKKEFIDCLWKPPKAETNMAHYVTET